MKFTIS